MVIDTSVFIAIFLAESDWPKYSDAINTAATRSMSAVSYVETAVVLERKLGPKGVDAFNQYRALARIDIIDITGDIAGEALNAYRRSGRGYHQAALNLGDVFSYATARLTGYPLLFKGNDFSLTDVAPAIE